MDYDYYAFLLLWAHFLITHFSQYDNNRILFSFFFHKNEKLRMYGLLRKSPEDVSADDIFAKRMLYLWVCRNQCMIGYFAYTAI